MSKGLILWEDKTKMITHFNKSEWVEGTNVFLQNIENLDEQSIDMFFTGLSLIKSDLLLAKENHIIISQKLKDAKTESFKTALRMAMYYELMEEILSESVDKIQGGNK